MEAVEVPHYFICPISLQIMKDPVTTPSGITYDRDSIEHWLFISGNTTCPITNQPCLLPRDFSSLTPNHTLRRLIQSWCTSNALGGIPAPRPPLDGHAVLRLLGNLSMPTLRLSSLQTIAALISESETNRCQLLRSGTAHSMVQFIISCCRKKETDLLLLDLSVTILHSLRIPADDLRPHVADNHELFDALTWLLLLPGSPGNNGEIRSNTVLVLKSMVEAAHPALLSRLKLDFFQAVTAAIRGRMSPPATKAALHVLLHACLCSGNRAKIVEAGMVREAIELELSTPDRRTTELDLALLDQLCSCADGRAELVGHASGLAVVSKRILRGSPAADEHGVRILSSVCRYAAAHAVLQEMLWVGAVAKLCCVLQADCSSNTKEKARWVLRLHSGVWRDSPCISAYLSTRYPGVQEEI